MSRCYLTRREATRTLSISLGVFFQPENRLRIIKLPLRIVKVRITCRRMTKKQYVSGGADIAAPVRLTRGRSRGLVCQSVVPIF